MIDTQLSLPTPVPLSPLRVSQAIEAIMNVDSSGGNGHNGNFKPAANGHNATLTSGTNVAEVPNMPITSDIDTAIHNLESNVDFEVVVSRLLSLADRSDEDYDEDFLPADLGAIGKALHLVYATGLRLGQDFPRALVGPNGAGGLSVEWRKPNAAVKLIMSPKRQQIFYMLGGECDFDEVSDSNLDKWLRKFIHSRSV